TLTLPLAPVADAGVNVTVKVALWPVVRVNGVVIPVRLNPRSEERRGGKVRMEPRVLVTVSARDLLLPTVTLPKLTLLGFAPRAPSASPVPANEMVRVGFDALEMTVTLPVALVADAGVNVTVKVALCPAVRVKGVVIPLRLNP